MSASRRSSRARARVAAASLLSALLCVACSKVAPKRLNVLLITLDTTRADYIGVYGGPPGVSPSLDALAAEGTRFDLAIATASLTPVSHASILSGLDNSEHGLRVLGGESGYRLPERVPTLATLLQAAGWHTAAVHSAFPVSSFFGFRRGFDSFDSLEASMTKEDVGKPWDTETYQRRSDETTTKALAVLADAQQPFFLWLHYWDPHDTKRIPPDEFLPDELKRGPEGSLLRTSEFYAAEVRYMDLQIGRVIAALRESGRLDDTLIAVVSDHGEGLGDHNWKHHRILYQEQIHVPLLLRVPGAPAGGVVKDLVRTTDICPTVLDYLDLAAPGPMSGRSLRPLIEGRPDAPRIAFADQINGYDLAERMLRYRPRDDFLYCAMDARWKLIYRPAHPNSSELYDLASDPKELRNVFDEHPEEARRLQLELARHGGWVTAPFPPDATAGDTQAARDALAQLGYADGAVPIPSDQAWSWTCAVHRDVTLDERKPCPQCGEPLLLVRKRP